MLEGREISILNNHELEKTLRLDSEFYSKENLELDKRLKTLNANKLTDYTVISDGNHMSISDYFTEKGIPYYRGGDIYNTFIEQSSNPLYIPRSVFGMKTMERSHLKKGDILMSIVGAIIGNLSLVSTDNDATCSCKLAIIRPFANLSPEYIMTFLKSEMGQSQIQRYRRGSGQTGFILEDFDQLLIPELNDKIQYFVSSKIHEAKRMLISGIEKYNSCVSILNKEMNIHKIQKDFSNIREQKISNSLWKSGRLDAEYYNLKYDALFKLLEEFDTKRLGDVVDIYKSTEPGSDLYITEGVPFIRVADITKFGITQPSVYLDARFFVDVIRPKKDSILLTKDGSVGIAYKVEKDENYITSGAILHLQIKDKKVLPDYLTLVLNSQFVQMQAERDAGGSIIQHWKPSEISNVVIPILPMEMQIEISKNIQESFKLKNESKQLLEHAKQAVEIAIRDNEEKALQFIIENKNGKSLYNK